MKVAGKLSFGDADHRGSLRRAEPPTPRFLGDERAARATFAGTIVFLRDQFPVPTQQGLWRYNCGDLSQEFATKYFGPGRQSTALVVVEPQSPPPELLAKHFVLFAKVIDGLQVAFVHPSGHGDQQEPGTDPELWASESIIVSMPWAANRRQFEQIQFSGQTGSSEHPCIVRSGWADC